MNRRFSLVFLIGAFGLLLSGVASALVEVTLSHKDTPDNSITEILSVADGETIKVTITDTEPENFTYMPTGIELVSTTSQKAADSSTIHQVEIEHSAKYGGYYLRIRFEKGKSKEDLKDKSLKEKTWIISTQETGWHTDVQVGLVGSELVKPEFFLDTGDDGVKRVARDRDAEDDAAFGFASFATVYHDRSRWWGGSLGLGINDNDLSVLIGPTLRLGRRAAITGGYSWSRVDRLPSGLAIGDSFDGDSLTLQKSTRGGWFLSVSIRGFTDVFQKKLADSSAQKKSE